MAGLEGCEDELGLDLLGDGLPGGEDVRHGVGVHGVGVVLDH